MKANINNDTRLSELTVADLTELILELTGQGCGRTIKGVSGLADYLGCSVRSAQRLKSSGRIDGAVTQSGRCIVIDESRLRRILKNTQ